MTFERGVRKFECQSIEAEYGDQSIVMTTGLTLRGRSNWRAILKDCPGLIMRLASVTTLQPGLIPHSLGSLNSLNSILRQLDGRRRKKI